MKNRRAPAIHSFSITPWKRPAETDNPISATSRGRHNPYAAGGGAYKGMHSDFYGYVGNPERPLCRTLIRVAHAVYHYLSRYEGGPINWLFVKENVYRETWKSAIERHVIMPSQLR